MHAVPPARHRRRFCRASRRAAAAAAAPGDQGGGSESVVGRWRAVRVKARGSAFRERVLIANEVGMPMGDEGSGRGSLPRRWIRQAVHE
jgi:hypothetical protein